MEVRGLMFVSQTDLKRTLSVMRNRARRAQTSLKKIEGLSKNKRFGTDTLSRVADMVQDSYLQLKFIENLLQEITTS